MLTLNSSQTISFSNQLDPICDFSQLSHKDLENSLLGILTSQADLNYSKIIQKKTYTLQVYSDKKNIGQIFRDTHSNNKPTQALPKAPTQRLALTYEGPNTMLALTYVKPQDFLVSFPVLTSGSSFIVLLKSPMIECNHLPNTSPAPMFSEGRITKLDRTSAFTSIPLGLLNHLDQQQVEEFQQQARSLPASKKDLSDDDDVTDPAGDYERISIESPFDDNSCVIVEPPTDDGFDIV